MAKELFADEKAFAELEAAAMRGDLAEMIRLIAEEKKRVGDDNAPWKPRSIRMSSAILAEPVKEALVRDAAIRRVMFPPN